jgi:hypothetical protein
LQKLVPVADVTPVNILSISNANPAVVTLISNTFINQFANGDTVVVEGASGSFLAANGAHTVANLNAGTGSFELTGVDTSAAAGPSTDPGMTVTPDTGEVLVNLLAASNAKPVVVTVGATDIGKFTSGQMVIVDGTGTSLDGKAYPADSVGVPANTLTLRGSDLSQNTTIVSAGTLSPISEADFLKWCLNAFEYTVEAAEAIDVSTFCEAESLAGTPSPGTISLGTWTDFKIPAYNEWRQAVKDGRRRVLRVQIPPKGGGGEIIYIITATGLTETYTLNEGVAFTGEAVVNEEPQYFV